MLLLLLLITDTDSVDDFTVGAVDVTAFYDTVEAIRGISDVQQLQELLIYFWLFLLLVSLPL